MDEDWKFDRMRDFDLALADAQHMAKKDPDLYLDVDWDCYVVDVYRKSDNKLVISFQ